jgi:hypothetical protein
LNIESGKTQKSVQLETGISVQVGPEYANSGRMEFGMLTLEQFIENLRYYAPLK